MNQGRNMGGESRTLYRVKFTRADGAAYRLDTFDETMIGPWLADMFGMFPFLVSMPSSVQIEASTGWLRG